MARVFISSTSNDLKDSRQQLSVLLRKMRHEDIAMEYFVAENDRPVVKCRSAAAAADIYVGVIAWRYGYIPPDDNPDGLSITEIEYRAAKEAGRPCLLFLLDGNAPWPRTLMDDDLSKIEGFRSRLQEAHTVNYFKSSEDIGAVVAPALSQLSSSADAEPAQAFTAYFNAMKRRYQRLDLDALTPPQKEEYLQVQLSSVFIEQNVRDNPPPVALPREVIEMLLSDREIEETDLPKGVSLDDVERASKLYYDKPEKRVLDVLGGQDRKRVVILGDPGSGKSTLVRYVLLSILGPLANRRIGDIFGNHLPLLIELRHYLPLYKRNKCDTFVDYLDYMSRTEGWSLDRGSLLRHLQSGGPVVMFFDGLDEIFNPRDRERIARNISGFSATYPQSRVIVTSRIIGYQRKPLDDAGFEHYTLQELNVRQVERFVDRWYSIALADKPDEARHRRERIMRSFAESSSIRQLAGNPMLLTIMAIIGKHQELPRERWKLYDHAASVLIEHWNVNKHLDEERLEWEFIGEDDKRELLRRLAYIMQTGAKGLGGNYLPREVLRKEFESYLADRYNQPPDRAVVIARAMIEQFRERNFILSLYGANLYGFVHRAFLEYFCAAEFVHKFEKTRELDEDSLITSVYKVRLYQQNWHEVLRLICGLIGEKFAGAIVRYLAFDPAGRVLLNEPSRLALAVQCLAEVRNIGAVADVANELLKWIWTLFQRGAQGAPELDEFLRDQIAPFASFIGPNWPNRSFLADSLKSLRFRRISAAYGEAFGRFCGSVGRGMSEVKAIILSYAAATDIRSLVAVYALAIGWRRDPDVLDILGDLAAKSPYHIVRSAVIEIIGEYLDDDSRALLILEQISRADQLLFIRELALAKIARIHEDYDQGGEEAQQASA